MDAEVERSSGEPCSGHETEASLKKRLGIRMTWLNRTEGRVQGVGWLGERDIAR